MVNRLFVKRKQNGELYSRRSVKDFFDVFRTMAKDAIVHLQLDSDPTLRISFGDEVMPTGQRFCHVSALKWSDVDWLERVIRFRRKQVRGTVGPISKRKPCSSRTGVGTASWDIPSVSTTGSFLAVEKR